MYYISFKDGEVCVCENTVYAIEVTKSTDDSVRFLAFDDKERAKEVAKEWQENNKSQSDLQIPPPDNKSISINICSCGRAFYVSNREWNNIAKRRLVVLNKCHSCRYK